MEIYDTITLPNGGHVVLDKLAYETYTGCGQSTHKYEWKYTIEFEGGNVISVNNHSANNQDTMHDLNDVIETAAMDINKYNLTVR
jgi:hypothetical protein